VSEAPQGIDAANVTSWFERNVEDVAPPLTFELITGGHSNLTFSVTDADGRRWVLRRPPLGHVLATAHDMSREYRIIDALGPTEVPVAPAIGLCTDATVNGAPFYVMGYVDGLVIRDAATAQLLTADQRRAAGDSIVDVLAAIHAVDVDAVGLGDLGRKAGYIERQLNRWYKQWEQSKTRELSAVDEVYARLKSQIPEQGPATIVHGDYRLDNCMVGDNGRIIAVLDWEICTLGDPLADVGLLMVYWNEADDSATTLLAAATAVEGFPKRKELLDRYAGASERDLGAIDFYVAFGYWKLACIVEGVYSRYIGGAMGNRDPAAFEPFARQVERCVDMAHQLSSQLP
jgi:aminoglycoside phosphotransferase (APT) family kinase protein